MGMTAADKQPSATEGPAANYIVPAIINGQEHILPRTFRVFNPITSELSHHCSSANITEAELAVQAAAQAFKTWGKTTVNERRKVMLRAADILEQRRSELVQYMFQETGAAAAWSNTNIDIAADLLRDVGGRCATISGAIPQTNDISVTGLVLNEPFGAVLSIAPWNAPYILGIRSVAFPLGAGNTVVLKGTELAPRTQWAIASVFQQAGLPDGALNLISSEPALAPQVTEALIANPLIKKINFTGSTMVGRIIGKLAGEYLKPVVQELGGKASAIVWEDADLDLAAMQCALGAFINSGQVCMSTERIIVHKAIAANFKKLLVAKTNAMFGASAGDGGLPLINEAAVAKNKQLVRDALDKGARNLLSDKAESAQAGCARMQPAILEHITRDMKIYYGESFGPSVSIFEVKNEEAALELASDTEYGLTASVFSKDLTWSLRVARAIESGAVHINSMTIHDESALPHGGAKASGYGRFNASQGLTEWVRTKTITIKD